MITEKLALVQQTLKAPKNQKNDFGGYKYRSCEDILEAVKPLLAQNGLTLTITDDIVPVGNRIYVKATATLYGDKETLTVSAFAREEESKKGMDASQVTGAASSYARKYALNGLFCIDDTRDADATNTHGKDETTPAAKKSAPKDETFTPVCKDCGKTLTDAEHDWSVKFYGMPLCREHQKQHDKIR